MSSSNMSVWLKWWCLSMKPNFPGSHLVWIDYRPRNTKSLQKDWIWWFFTANLFIWPVKSYSFPFFITFWFPYSTPSPDIFWPIILNFYLSKKLKTYTFSWFLDSTSFNCCLMIGFFRAIDLFCLNFKEMP